jgi:hypothetical protein
VKDAVIVGANMAILVTFITPFFSSIGVENMSPGIGDRLRQAKKFLTINTGMSQLG